MPRDLRVKLYHLIRQRRLFLPDTVLLVAVSGGADSLALLHLLRDLAPEFGFRLHTATLNHGLRGAAGAEDTAFVSQRAAAWSIPVTVGSVDVAVLAEMWKLSIEAAARRARYAFLAAAAREIGAQQIVTAHHADDQAETVLLHLLRGAGVAGLAGMRLRAPLPDHANLELVRPLLDATRAEIELYCQTHALHPREDATNADVTYLRNYLRHEVLPLLRTVNPQVNRALTQLAQIAAEESAYLDEQLQALLGQGIVVNPDWISVPRPLFNKTHAALLRRLLVWGAAQLGGAELDYDHILGAEQIARTGAVGACVVLANGLCLSLDYDRLFIHRVNVPLPLATDVPLMPSDLEIPVNIPGETVIPGANGRLIAYDHPQAEAVTRLMVAPDSRVLLRTRRPGDRWQPYGLNGHSQKLKKWLIDHKVPQRQRERLPLLIIDDQIAAILINADQWPAGETFAGETAGSGRMVWFKWHFDRVVYSSET